MELKKEREILKKPAEDISLQDEKLKRNLEKRQCEKSELKLNIEKTKQENLKKAKGDKSPQVKEVKIDKEKYNQHLKI